MEKKYKDALVALSEILLEQHSEIKMKDWEIENLKEKIVSFHEKDKKGV